MRLLPDTQVALWFLTASPRLSKAARELMARSPCVVSVASIWEVALKHRLGKLPVSPGRLRDEMRSAGAVRLSVSDDHVLATADLTAEHLSLPKIWNRFCPLHIVPAHGRVSASMAAVIVALCAGLRSSVLSRGELALEILALRHQLAVLHRERPRPRLRQSDRLVWVLLSRLWPRWRGALQIVTPDTVVRWHRQAFRLYRRWRSAPRRPGRPAIAADVRALIEQMHGANPLWRAPRIHGELQKLGIVVAQFMSGLIIRPSAGTS